MANYPKPSRMSVGSPAVKIQDKEKGAQLFCSHCWAGEIDGWSISQKATMSGLSGTRFAGGCCGQLCHRAFLPSSREKSFDAPPAHATIYIYT